jgi:tetratricopeptide (TPR) repeat protein
VTLRKKNPIATQPIRTEETISGHGPELMDLIPAWLESGRGKDALLGAPRTKAIALADEFRRRLRSNQLLATDLSNRDEAADILHALCARLSEECVDRPEAVLEEAASIRDLAEGLEWANENIGEWENLLCSLAFTAWRASRILRLPHVAQRWESEYKKVFRSSLIWNVAESICESESGLTQALENAGWTDPESVFQVLLYLQDQRDVDPVRASTIGEGFYRLLQGLKLPRDLHPFLLAEVALLVGGSLRQIGRPRAVDGWSELAVRHVRDDSNPRPSLARIALLRILSLYEQSRYDLVVKAAPALEQSFADLGMEEDRVKCRIVWASSLKLLGHFQEALDVLEPIQQWKSTIRSGLYGWVLLNSGDLHQICGHYSLALTELAEAEHLLREARQFTALADVNAMISCVYRSHGMLREALQLLRSSCDDHARLGMKSLEAANRMLIAETYLAMGRSHDAEVEIRAAIPVFEEQEMVVDAVAAVNLLREAIRRQRFDPQPISDIRDRRRPKK